MMMSKAKAIILPFFLLAGIASGSQQPQGSVVGGNNYYGEDVEGSSQQRRTALSGEDDVAPQQQDAYNNRRLHFWPPTLPHCRVDADCSRIFSGGTCVNGMCIRKVFHRDDVATYLEDEYAVHSTTTDFYDDYEIENADEVGLDESRRQLRGNSNRRLNSIRQCHTVGLARSNGCQRDERCWTRRVGSSFDGSVCVRHGACLPSGVFAQQNTRNGSVDWMRRNCCSGRTWEHGNSWPTRVRGCQ